MSLSHDGDRRMNETEHDEAYDCLPSGILGCLPWCLCGDRRMAEREAYDCLPSGL